MKEPRVVHLDDHEIVRKTIESIISKEISCSIIGFANSAEALTYIRNGFQNNDEINLIITDLRHPGLNGYEFSKEVKNIANDYGKRTSILLLCIDSEPNQIIKKGLEEKIFDKHLSLSSSSDEIIGFCKSVL
jgi:DNA-binding NarL/FixJ family response regulator